jgi:biotin operon repressor
VLVSVGYNKSELLAAGLDTGALRANGCSIEKLKDAGYALGDLISARYDAPALLSAGYSLAELKSAKFDASQLKSAGCTVLQLRTVGFTLKELKIAGYDSPQLAEGGYLLTELYAVGFDTASLRPALFPAWCIEHRGWFYRTLGDGWHPHNEGRNDQEGIYLPLPMGFEMVPEELGEGGSREVITRYPWSTSVIVLGNGVGW